ncbi:uncharacterized protein LOC129247638 isoform X1 [Anastrepha obliqua]|uniref:uncharacterized protein LOC129247638 isoform X1 n=1 Tax=Anastrepha obliqua TaxID=95512 RepID=UPI0024093936|nr:uncharacterized protein LOC129247638 isoform X1 [Anastrepha obliqua]
MSSTKFIAILPQATQPGDIVQISGKISVDAKEFSINFANEVNENPQSIAYQFKWDLANNVLNEGCKENDEWIKNKETQFDALDGRFKTHLTHANKANTNDILSKGFLNTNSVMNTTDAFVNSNSYSLLGPEFALEFAFQDDGIYVYLVCEDGRNYITQFQPESDFQYIESIQVWGDVEKITHLSFSYN